ncbi:MAG: hypothetical protein IKO75_00275 [Bacteroidales bacterium]|nr:hypothetical protein [Bacteroidales bacterium]
MVHGLPARAVSIATRTTRKGNDNRSTMQPASAVTSEQLRNHKRKRKRTANAPFRLATPPLPETTRISETHRTNVKVRLCPAKRKLGLARAEHNEKRTHPASARPGGYGIPFCHPVLTSHRVP